MVKFEQSKVDGAWICKDCGVAVTPTPEEISEHVNEEFVKFLKETISADMLYHPTNLKKHFQSKITALTENTKGVKSGD